MHLDGTEDWGLRIGKEWKGIVMDNQITPRLKCYPIFIDKKHLSLPFTGYPLHFALQQPWGKNKTEVPMYFNDTL